MKSNIEKILKNYLDVYPNESEKLKKLKELLDHNKDNYNNLFNRKNMEGHITASGYVYSVEDKKLLLLEHKSLNSYVQPGGHCELFDDTLVDTAKREIKEETGFENLEKINIYNDVDIPIDINTHFIPENSKKNEGDHFHHDFRYLFVVPKIHDIKVDKNESNGYIWMSLNDVKNLENFKYVLKKIEKYI